MVEYWSMPPNPAQTTLIQLKVLQIRFKVFCFSYHFVCFLIVNLLFCFVEVFCLVIIYLIFGCLSVLLLLYFLANVSSCISFCFGFLLIIFLLFCFVIHLVIVFFLFWCFFHYSIFVFWRLSLCCVFLFLEFRFCVCFFHTKKWSNKMKNNRETMKYK